MEWTTRTRSQAGTVPGDVAQQSGNALVGQGVNSALEGHQAAFAGNWNHRWLLRIGLHSVRVRRPGYSFDETYPDVNVTKGDVLSHEGPMV